MKIPRELPQFKEHKALLIVSARQTALIYVAHKGNITEEREIKITNPEYSDREGFFTSSSKGARLGSGSVYESKTQVAHTEFLNRFQEVIKDVLTYHKEAGAVYLFAPATHAAAIKDALPAANRKLLKKTFQGNYTNYDPMEILEKISARRTKRKTRASRAAAPKEARKLLKKPGRTRRK
jgi:hypothetical protein